MLPSMIRNPGMKALDEYPSIERNPYFVKWFPTPEVRGIPEKYGIQVRHYNPALCQLPDGRLWAVWRIEMNTGSSQLGCGVLSPDSYEIQDPRWLEVGHDNPEDPRLIRCGDEVWLNYLGVRFSRMGFVVEQTLLRVDSDFQEVTGERIVPPIGKNAKGVEKNWTFFAVPGEKEPLIHYSPEEGGVYTLKGEQVAPPAQTPWRHPCGSWSGRSQAHLVGDRYVAIGGGAYWWPKRLKRYFLSAWSFDAAAPFTSREISEEPLVWACDDDPRIPSPRDARHAPCVVFTGGAHPLEDGNWLVPVGIHDSHLALFKIPFDKFAMVPLGALDHLERKKTYHEAIQAKAAKLRIRRFKPLANPPANERAIVYPWKHDDVTWQELRFSLRSIEKHFEDRECPIYILGTKQPNFLLQKAGRVRFMSAWSYWEALSLGVQMARKVLWMNDDIFLLRDSGWEDCEGAKYYDTIDPEFIENVGPQANPWKAGVIRILKLLVQRGVEDLRVYSTHVPYVFERKHAMATLKEFGVWDKMPFELAYYHLYGTKHRELGNERVSCEPYGKARFLNVIDHRFTPEMKEDLQERFPDYASWELPRPFPGGPVDKASRRGRAVWV